jgi:hypothetical protein
MALALVGDRRITRLDDEAQTFDPLARYCAEFYPQARQEALAAHRWTFAKRLAELVRREGEFTVDGFSYVHVLPTDCLRVMEILRGVILPDETRAYSGKVDQFRIYGRDVRSKEALLAVRYVADVEDPKEWSPHFRTAVARLLAHYISGPIGNDPQMSQMHLENYERVALPNAQYYDAVQDNSNENHDARTQLAGSPTLQARFNSRFVNPHNQSDYID